MQSTLSSRRMSIGEIESYARNHSHGSAAKVDLPNFSQGRHAHGTERHRPAVRHAAPSHNQPADNKRHARVAAVQTAPKVAPIQRPQLVPSAVPQREGRRAPLVVRLNRALRTALVAFCGLAILGYGFDVAVSNDVGRLQDQARRLNEQNSELSAQLLKAISFQGIQDSVLGRAGLRVPEQVLIVKEVAPPEAPKFEPAKHHFPIMSGY
jgi:hypothetical protein